MFKASPDEWDLIAWWDLIVTFMLLVEWNRLITVDKWAGGVLECPANEWYIYG